MTQPQKDLEQNPTAKRFSAPDVTAWDAPRKQSFCDEKIKITPLKSGSQALPETKATAITHPDEIAKATAATIRKKPCSGQRVLRPDSHVPRVFDRVGMKFMERVQVYTDRLSYE